MDLLFIEGVAATIAALVVFNGSIFLLLMMVTGPRLAYFVTASVTLAFIVIMGIVWSINPLGPVGELPEWVQGRMAEEPSELDFGPASQYPEAPWAPPDEDDEQQLALASELETTAIEVAGERLEKSAFGGFESADDTLPEEGATRLLEQDGETYGIVRFEAAEGVDERGSFVVLMRRDPGDPLGQARMITLGAIVLLGLHLFGLSRSERRAARRSAAAEGAAG